MSDQWPLPPPSSSSSAGEQGHGAESSSNTRWYALLGASLVVVFGLLAAATGIVGFGGEDTLETVEAAPAAPVFQPAFEEGPDPFFPIDLQLAGFQEETGEQPSDEAVASGLFGGTAQNTCDPQRLIDFLMQNPTEAQAWAQVQGIEVDEIPAYINSLAVRVLAAPATVLNHSFDPVTGAPYEIETTLDAGTAVLVDEAGDIRTRCYCGNPVKPKPVGHRPPRCLVAAGMVYVVPGGEARRSDVPGDVVLTGQVTADDDWVEISWGSDESQTGWTRSSNLQPNLCPVQSSTSPTPAPTAPSPTAEPLTPTPATPTPPDPAPTLPAATPPPATPTATPPPAPTLPAATPPPATPTATATATPTPTPPTQQVEIRCFISDTDIMVLEQVEFSAFSVPGDSSIVYAFDHGDGFIDDRNPSFAVYSDPGSYDVTVIATIQGEEQRVFCGTVVVTGTSGGQGCSDQGYVGLTQQQAGIRAESMGCGWRVTKIDGEAQFVTGDFREDRVNFELEGGIVTRASIG